MVFQISLGPGLVLPTKIFHKLKPRKVGSYVANIMAATLSREVMATHSFKGQKGKNGTMKPRLDPTYTSTLIGKFSNICNKMEMPLMIASAFLSQKSFYRSTSSAVQNDSTTFLYISQISHFWIDKITRCLGFSQWCLHSIVLVLKFNQFFYFSLSYSTQQECAVFRYGKRCDRGKYNKSNQIQT